MLADSGVVLELCPTSNLHTRAVRHLEDFQFIVNVFREKKVRYTINTDGTYLCSTTLRREFSLLREAGVLTDDEAETARQLAFDVSFICCPIPGAGGQRRARSDRERRHLRERARGLTAALYTPRAPTWRRCSSRRIQPGGQLTITTDVDNTRGSRKGSWVPTSWRT